MSKYGDVSKTEVNFFNTVKAVLNPSNILSVGNDSGRYLSQFNIGTKILATGFNITIKYPISPNSKIVQGNPLSTINRSNIVDTFDNTKIDFVMINRYKGITNLAKLVNQINKDVTSNTSFLIKLNNEDKQILIRLFELLKNFGLKYKKITFKYNDYLFFTKPSKLKEFNDLYNKNKFNAISKFNIYTRSQVKWHQETINKPKCLAVLLCYNDGDILEETMKHMIKNKHDLVVWNHGSTDNTQEVIDKYKDFIVEYRYIKRDFDFYYLYQSMSKNIIDNYSNKYDIVSWPDQDELLEGPDRTKSYYEHLVDFHNSDYTSIKFNNFIYWITEKDKIKEKNPVQRLKYYSLYPDCSPRIRTYKMKVADIRFFNHNKPKGSQYPVNFNLMHFPMRTKEQLIRRLTNDRVGIARSNMHFHYAYMKHIMEQNKFPTSKDLFYDNGTNDLNGEIVFNWRTVYGSREKFANIKKHK